MSICVIPARGGSKRIPRKNIRLFHGQPMISWSINAAVSSGCFEQIVVSTDDDEIAQISQECGAEATFRRSSNLADDHTPIVPVIADAISQLDIGANTPVCCLFATAPFVMPADLKTSFNQLKKTKAPFVFSVTKYGFPIQRALRRKKSGEIEMLDPRHTLTRSQDLEEAWHDAGQFYWGLAKAWTSGQAVFEKGAQGVPLPRYCVQDIDTEEDWRHAELIMRNLQIGDTR
jgi:pseudaminic acid cytidylyltransferase